MFEERTEERRDLVSEPLEAFSSYHYTRMSAPAPGRSLGATVSRIGRPLRAAVESLSAHCTPREGFIQVLRSATITGPGCAEETWETRISWFLASVVMVYRTLHQNQGSVQSALGWFYQDEHWVRETMRCFAPVGVQAADVCLRDSELIEHCPDLLPYLLEPHGHITRQELETSQEAAETRNKKKADGVYYTPSDVAEFMVASIADRSDSSARWLDPACGTGVFLRAISRRLSASTSESAEAVLSRIFGIDRSALATDLAGFVLTLEGLLCSIRPTAAPAPFDLWKRAKRNLRAMDTLRLIRGPRNNEGHDADATVTFASVFESAPNGFERIVMNPPYASVVADETLRRNWASFELARNGQAVDAHLAFTEMMWRFAAKDGRSAAVLPLSIGANTGQAYRGLRQTLMANKGTCDFLFFDREPQALFGEDIKTRNLILIRVGGSESTIKTSRLLKWTAKQRKAIFTGSRAITVPPELCVTFVPKLGSTTESRAYAELVSSQVKASAVRSRPVVSRITLDELGDMPENWRESSVLVGSTAYNFVNGFFVDGIPEVGSKPFSASPLNALCFSSEADAFAGYAILSSRLCFWLWHVEGDGFHLTADFLKRLPFWAVLGRAHKKATLSLAGKALWKEALRSRQAALNAGKQTFSFHAGFFGTHALQIERLLVGELGLGAEIHQALDEFVEASVSIDGARRART